MAELHIIGQVVGASGFGNAAVFCKWECHAGRSWELLEGLEGGQTHVDTAGDEAGMAAWAHPIDIHYACRGLTGWPRLAFQVWTHDMHERNDIRGYGFCHIPAAPGTYELDCPTWLPEGSAMERLSAFFLGGNPRLKMEEVIYTSADRFRLQTTSGGVIHLQISIVMKDFERNGVQCE